MYTMVPSLPFLKNSRRRIRMNGKKVFEISVKVDTPIVVGQDEISGRRQLIPILSGELKGDNMHGVVLAGGVDSQVIRPSGICELSARYGVKLDDGSSFYVQNDGIRTVPDAYVEEVKQGKFIAPELYYFCTKPQFEVYGEELQWMLKKIFVCQATRLPDQVILEYYIVE